MSNNRRSPARRSRAQEQFVTPEEPAAFHAEPSTVNLQPPTVIPPVPVAAETSAPPANAVAIMTGIAALGLLFCFALLLFSL